MMRAATRDDHGELVKLAKTHPATRDFSNHMFSGEAAYKKGWIRVWEEDGKIVGMTCVRHKVRAPETSLYYIVVHPSYRSSGIGDLLIKDLMKQCPNPRIVLNVLKDNEGARRFYDRLGFSEEGESLKGKGVKLAKEWTP